MTSVSYETRNRSWTLNRSTCSNQVYIECDHIFAFTINERFYSSDSYCLKEINNPDILALFKIFLIMSSDVYLQNEGYLFLESLISEDVIPRIIGYTFFLCTTPTFNVSACFSKIQKKHISNSKQQRFSKETMDGSDNNTNVNIESNNNKIICDKASIAFFNAALKTSVLKYIGYICPSVDSPDRLDLFNGLPFTLENIFSILNAFTVRSPKGLHSLQQLNKLRDYLNDSNNDDDGADGSIKHLYLRFPLPEFVYRFNCDDLCHVSSFLSRPFPHKILENFHNNNSLEYVDTILNLNFRHADILTESGFIDEINPPAIFENTSRREEIQAASRTVGTFVDISSAELFDDKKQISFPTFEYIREQSERRCESIQRVSTRKHSMFQTLKYPMHAARKLRIEHSIGTIQNYLHYFSNNNNNTENISPMFNVISNYIRNVLPHEMPVVINPYKNVSCFTYRILEKWKWYGNNFMVVSHNRRYLELIQLGSLDAYNYDGLDRIGFNVILHSREPGTGKSNLIINVLRKMRIADTITSLHHVTLRAHTSDHYEQCDRIWVFDELPKPFVIEDNPNLDEEIARGFKLRLTNPRVVEMVYHSDPTTGKRSYQENISLWIGSHIAACNLNDLRTNIMSHAMHDRFLVLAFDESRQAVERIKMMSADFTAHMDNSAFTNELNETCKYFKCEQALFVEIMKLIRIKALLGPTMSGVKCVLKWLFHRLEALLCYNMTARDMMRIEILLTIIATQDALARTYFDYGDKKYDIFRMMEVEKRNIVMVKHLFFLMTLAPELFINIHEYDIRKALRQIFLADAKHSFALDIFKRHNNNNEIDPTYIKFKGGNNGLHNLVERIHSELSIMDDIILLPSKDCIYDTLKRWKNIQMETYLWKQTNTTSTPPLHWPTEIKTSPKEMKYLVEEFTTASNYHFYFIQTQYISNSHETMKRYDLILQQLMFEFCHFRHQGGFEIPFIKADTQSPSIVYFKKQTDTNSDLFCIPNDEHSQEKNFLSFDMSMDEVSLQDRNNILYITGLGIKRLLDEDENTIDTNSSSVANSSSNNNTAITTEEEQLYFFGKPLKKFRIHQTLVNEEQEKINSLLDRINLENDFDLPNNMFVLNQSLIGNEVIWQRWAKEITSSQWENSDQNIFQFITLTKSNVVGMGLSFLQSEPQLQAIFARNRGIYKCICSRSEIEEIFLKQKFNISKQFNYNNQSSEANNISRKKKWEMIEEKKIDHDKEEQRKRNKILESIPIIIQDVEEEN